MTDEFDPVSQNRKAAFQRRKHTMKSRTITEVDGANLAGEQVHVK